VAIPRIYLELKVAGQLRVAMAAELTSTKLNAESHLLLVFLHYVTSTEAIL
jgi:hypothetical protein